MSVWFDPRGARWRYKFRIDGKPHQADAIDPETGEMARNKTDAKRIERLAKTTAEIHAKKSAAERKRSGSCSDCSTCYPMTTLFGSPLPTSYTRMMTSRASSN